MTPAHVIIGALWLAVAYFAWESISSYYRERRRRELLDRFDKQTWTHASGPAEWR